jgi:hypothetical protein
MEFHGCLPLIDSSQPRGYAVDTVGSDWKSCLASQSETRTTLSETDSSFTLDVEQTPSPHPSKEPLWHNPKLSKTLKD